MVHSWLISHSSPSVSVLSYNRFSSSFATISLVRTSPSFKFVALDRGSRSYASLCRTFLFSRSCVSRNWLVFLRNAFNWSSTTSIALLSWPLSSSANVICSTTPAFWLSFKRKTLLLSHWSRSMPWFRCPRLIHLTCSWAYAVTDVGFSDITSRCDHLEDLSLIGCYQIYGDILNDVPHRYLRSIKSLNFEQCNHIQDDLLLDLYRRKKTISIVNYYGSAVNEDDDE